MPRRHTDRFTIASFPQQVQVDADFAETTWDTLEHAITEINKRNTSNLSFEQLYRYSYNLVLHKKGDFLYSRLTRLQTAHLHSLAAVIRAAEPPAFLPELHRQWSWFDLSLAHVRDVLMYMDRHYVKARRQKTVYELGIALFRQVVINHPDILPRLCHTLLATIDRERNGEPVDTPLMRAITRMLAQLGDNDDGTSVYASVFENDFLEKTCQFYAREATLYFSESTCADYLNKASQRIHEERLRVEAYLEPQTAAKVRTVVERELITKYMTKLIDMHNSGLVVMLRNDKLADLRLMYTLFRDIDNGDDVLRTNVKKEILDRGTEIVNNPDHVKDPIQMINAILALREKYEHIVNTAFTLPGAHIARNNAAVTLSSGAPIGTLALGTASSILSGSSSGDGVSIVGSGVGATSGGTGLGGASNERGPLLASVTGNTVAGSSSASSGTGGGCCVDTGSGNDPSAPAVGTGIPDKKYASSVNEAFERFINAFPDAAEFVSLYVDKLLRRDFKGSSDEEVESKLDEVMTLFRYLHEKDAFQRYYQQHVTKRLLYAKAATSEAERSFIAKMKMDCGYMYTSKMEVMFNDMKTSEETTVAFKEQVVQQQVSMEGVDMSVSVLTTMSWPITQSVTLQLPSAVMVCTSRFEDYYYNKHEGRKLSWQSELGTADIRGRFGDCRSRVVDFVGVSSCAMSILMLFNERDTMTYTQIKEATGIVDAELRRHLQSLSLAKYRVLKKDTKVKEVQENDRFTFNVDFATKNRRIKLQVISARKENEGEKSQTRAKIDDDRRPVIDTVIVRIMKHRKVLEHNKLIVEVTNLLASRFEPNPQEIKKRIESLVEREYLERQQDKRQVYQYVA